MKLLRLIAYFAGVAALTAGVLLLCGLLLGTPA